MADLEVSFHALDAAPPPGWGDYRKSSGLTCAWDWSLMQARAADRAVPHFALLVEDAGSVVGIGGARLPGLRIPARLLPGTHAAPRPLAGVLDVDCLVSSAVTGLEVQGGAEGYEAALIGLRRAARRQFGRRVSAILFRQVPEGLLSTATRFPSVVLEAPPVGRHRLAYDSFDAYLRSLSGSRRNEFRQIERDTDVVVTYTGRGDPRPSLEITSALRIANDAVYRHHKTWWLPKRLTGPAMLAAAARHPEVEIATYRKGDGELLGFGLALGGGDWPISWIAGHRLPGPGVRGGLWFHRELLYSWHWIEAGVPGYVSGAGTDAAKIRLGHQMTPVWSVLHPLVGAAEPRFLRTAT